MRKKDCLLDIIIQLSIANIVTQFYRTTHHQSINLILYRVMYLIYHGVFATWVVTFLITETITLNGSVYYRVGGRLTTRC